MDETPEELEARLLTHPDGRPDDPVWDPLNSVLGNSVVVKGEGVDDVAVGLVVNTAGTHVVATVKGTPAAEAGLEEAARAVGLPVDWDEANRIDQMISAGEWFKTNPQPQKVDGRMRSIAIRHLAGENAPGVGS